MGLNAIIRKVVVVGFLLYSHANFAQACEQINCDCFSLPSDLLKSACLKQQDVLLATCTQSSPAAAYCSIHGPKANPVAVITRLLNVPATSDIKSENRKIATLYWSVRQDANYSSASFMDGETGLGTALSIVNISKNNLKNLYTSQASVVQFWLDEDNSKKASKAWRDYSADTLSLAEHWAKYADSLTQHINQQHLKGQIITVEERALYEAVLGVTGEIYEQAGFAYGHSGKEKGAALAWKAAALTTTDIIALLVLQGVPEVELDEYRALAASRLNRASYYWLQDKNEDDAEDMAKKALEYLAKQQLHDVILQDG